MARLSYDVSYWIHNPARLLLVLAALTVISCVAPTRVYKLYPGHELPPSQLAIVNIGTSVGRVRVDGITIWGDSYSSVALVPGPHTIAGYGDFTFFWSDPSEIAVADAAILLAGHSYTIQADRILSPPYETFIWISDDATDEIVAGKPKP